MFRHSSYDLLRDSRVTPNLSLAIRDDNGDPIVSYDYTSQLKSILRANRRETAFIWNPVARLSRLNHKTLVYTDFTYNPASQLATRYLSNDAYAWDADYDVDRDYVTNTLNQYEQTEIGGTPTAIFAYDLNGNLTGDGTNTYTYDPENRMTAASGPN